MASDSATLSTTTNADLLDGGISATYSTSITHGLGTSSKEDMSSISTTGTSITRGSKQ